jgi:hypothetical protein
VKEGQNEPSSSYLGNVIAARSALLDFYGDRATSFVSLFIASIFGLVTISAIIQTMLFGMVGQETILSQFFNNVKLSLNSVIIIVSVFMYVTFVEVALYTYKRYTFYSDLADKLAKCDLSSMAKLDCIPVGLYKKDMTEKILQRLNHAAEIYAADLKDEDKDKAKIIETDEKYLFNFAIHEKYMIEQQKEGRVKKILGSKKFMPLTYLLFLGLALLTYYPLFTLLFRN